MKKIIISTFIFIGLISNLYSQKKYEIGQKLSDFKIYDLQKEIEKNKENKKKGTIYNYSSFLIDGFQNKYYRGEKINWYEPKDKKKSLFHYRGEMTDQSKQKHSITLSWQSYSDGLEWIYWVVELIRNDTKSSSFEIIKDKKMIEKIQNTISFKKKDKIDVFLYQFYYVVTTADTENIVFPDIKEKDFWYGVYYKEQLFLFDEQGTIQKPKQTGWGY